MATMKDIAKLAGVSYGTVSNVLNKRGNVSLDKIRIVEKAAKELGYYINDKARALRSNKTEDVALIIPTLEDYKLRKLYNLLRKKITLEGFKLNLYVTDFNPLLEEEYSKLATRINKYIIINTCLSNTNKLYESNIFKRSTLIFFNSSINISKHNVYHLNYDSKQLSIDMLSYIKKRKYTNVLLFTDKDVINTNFIKSECIDYYECSQPFNLSTALDILSKNEYNLIIVSSIEKYESIVSARKILQKTANVEIIVISADNLSFDNNILQYQQNLNLYVEYIFPIIDNKATLYYDKNEINLPYSGFLNISKNHNPNEYINILLIESPATSALLKVNPYIEKQLGFKINIDVIKYNQYDTIMNKKTLEKYDLVRIDMAYLSEIAEILFKPLDKSFNELTSRFINKDEYSFHNEVMYALPFDIGCQILMYRNDVLNNQQIKRAYYEQTKKTEIIPTTYEDYNLLEEFINKNYGDTFKGSTVCTGSSITCGNEFLIRVPVNNLLDNNDNLDISNPQVLKALKSYLKSISYSKSNNVFWDDVVKEYSEGNTVMSIVYSNYIHLLKEFNKEILYKTSFAFTPSMKSLIGGGVIGLTKNTKKDDLCYEFLEVLYSEKISKLITHLGGAMPIKSIYNDINLIFMYPWLKFIPDIIENNTRKHYNSKGAIYKTIEYEKKIGREVKKHITYNN